MCRFFFFIVLSRLFLGQFLRRHFTLFVNFDKKCALTVLCKRERVDTKSVAVPIISSFKKFLPLVPEKQFKFTTEIKIRQAYKT